MITVSDEQETLEVGTTRDELVKYLITCTSTEYANEVLAWYDRGDLEAPFRIPNGDYSIDTWKNT